MSLRLHDTLSGETRPFEPLRAGPGRCLLVRPDRLRTGPYRQLPLVPVRRPARPPPALARLPGDLGHEHHRHRRQDHPRRRRHRRAHRGRRRALPGGLPGRCRGRPDDAPRRAAACHPPHRADHRAHLDAPRARARLSDRRRLDLLPDLVVARLRPAGPPRPRGPAGGGAGRSRRIRQGRRPRLRPVEGPEARRAVVGDADRARPARLAYRVLGDEHDPPRSVVRHPHRWRGPDLPASRGRDRPERGGDRPDLRRDVAPLRAPPDGWRQDGEAERQHREGRRADRRRRPGPGPAPGPHLGPLSGRVEPLRRIARGVGGGDRPARCRGRGADRLRRGRTGRCHAARRAGRRSGGIRSRPRRRPQRVGRAGGRVRPRARPEPADRATLAVQRGFGPRARPAA